ncbi:MAG: IS66 family insertion sequence element accessory protein TnpB [Anaerolineaceae bacterium]|nr:IS66 family insertion sequence element accessory protein TnpB [Oscillospiraceae bacterium]MBQ3466089.1 IS66 family insertion sequence element accessory protein TnpB [Bacillota bacterium]MBQ6344180.1 IS66 family insertion sequence element accessory protein TnpB [Anaerolineaceae bacterium]
MLYDAKGFEKIYVAPGYTDLRKGIDGLAMTIGSELNLNPYQKNVLFLFCGRHAGKIKGLVWEGDGFVLLYKRLEDGRFIWPRTPQEVLDLSQEQFERLMQGFRIESTIRKVKPKEIC